MAKPSSLLRWSGLVSVLGAVLLIVNIALSSPLRAERSTSTSYEIYNLLLHAAYSLPFNATLLFAVGLVVFHARKAKRS